MKAQISNTTIYLIMLLMLLVNTNIAQTTFPIVGTNQTAYFNNSSETEAVTEGQSFFGQNANYLGNVPQYKDNGDGTVTDLVSGMMWQQSCDFNSDDLINVDDKLSYDEALAGADTFSLAGYSDWRLPSIKEAYSLILFSGKDPSGYEGTDTDGLVPFMDDAIFAFGYGDTDAGERIIDAQFASSTKYVHYTMNGDDTMFGVNLADGRIKGYPTGAMPGQTENKQFYVMYVRANENYGINDFSDNGNGTITDNATGLMWSQNDSGKGMLWEDALSYAENFEYSGYSDWRLPDTKELQSIVDYTRSPETSNSPAIDPLFSCSEITNEAGETDYGFYWTSTTHENWSQSSGSNAAYVCFGKALGNMNGTWMDVHGAGAQRSDPKTGDPADYPTGHGPQGDAIRIYNYVRLVRNTDETTGLNDTKTENQLRVYPNPADDQLNIKLIADNSELSNIKLINILGKVVHNETRYLNDNSILSIANIDSGVYFLSLENNNKTYTQKVVKK